MLKTLKYEKNFKFRVWIWDEIHVSLNLFFLVMEYQTGEVDMGYVYGPPCSCCNLQNLCFLPHCCSYGALLVTDCPTSLVTTSPFARLPKPREQSSYQLFSLLSCWLSLPRLPYLMKGFWNRGNLSFSHSLGEEINCNKGIKVQLPFQVQFFINDN